MRCADSNCLDNQPHWYPLFDEDRSTRFGPRPRVQTLSPSDSSESSTTTRRSSADSLSGLDKSAGVTRTQRKRGAATTTLPANGSASAAGRFRGDPDGSPVPQQATRAGGGGSRTAGSEGSTPRRRPYGQGSPTAGSSGAPPTSDGGRVRRDLDVDLIPTEDSFEIDNEECVDELFLKHNLEHQQRQQQQQQQPASSSLVAKVREPCIELMITAVKTSINISALLNFRCIECIQFNSQFSLKILQGLQFGFLAAYIVLCLTSNTHVKFSRTSVSNSV